MENKEDFVLSEESVCELVLSWRHGEEIDTEFLTEKYDPKYDWGKPKEYGGYTFGNEESYGGRSGSGENHWVVFYAEKDGVKTYYKIPGYYASYDGATLEWGYLFEVDPVEKTVIDWQKKSKN